MRHSRVFGHSYFTAGRHRCTSKCAIVIKLIKYLSNENIVYLTFCRLVYQFQDLGHLSSIECRPFCVSASHNDVDVDDADLLLGKTRCNLIGWIHSNRRIDSRVQWRILKMETLSLEILKINKNIVVLLS